MAQSLDYPTPCSSHMALAGGLTPPAAQKDPHAGKTLKAFVWDQAVSVDDPRSGQQHG